jgi:hypothetical protein
MKLTHTKRLFLAVVVITASCSFNHPVPEGWKLPPLVEGDKCPDISGQYKSWAEFAGKSSPPNFFEVEVASKSAPPNLFDQLNGGWARSSGFKSLVDPDWKGEHEIEIQMVSGVYATLIAPDPDWKGEHGVVIRQGNEDQLDILYKTVAGAILKKSALKKERGDFYCKDGWILTEVKIYDAPIPTTIIRSFAKADGYLLERVESSTFNILGFPGYGERTDWFRYSHVESKVDESPAH